MLTQVKDLEINKDQAAGALSVTRTRVNQLLRRRRLDQPETLTTIVIAKLDTPRGRSTYYKKRASATEFVFVQINHNRSIRTCHDEDSPQSTASGS